MDRATGGGTTARTGARPLVSQLVTAVWTAVDVVSGSEYGIAP